MLVLLPPSEGKTSPEAASTTLKLAEIAPFKTQLAAAREDVLNALEKISAQPDALEVLGVGPRLSAEIEANTHLRNAPTAPAYEIYSGVLFENGEIAKRGEIYQPQLNFQVLVQSALFGLVDLQTRIPAYRLSMDTKLGELGALATFWKKQLTPLLTDLSDHEIIVDCRSGSYIKAWPALQTKATTHQLLRVNVVRERNGKRSVVSHNAKKFRGMLAGALIEANAEGTLSDSLESVLQVAQSLIGKDDVIGVETSVQKTTRNLLSLPCSF